MKVDKQLLVPFSKEKPSYEFYQNWPKGSKFLKLVTLPEGIFSFFLVPELLLTDSAGSLESEQFHFIIGGPAMPVNEDDVFIDIASVFTELSPEELKKQGLPVDYQAVVVFPIFMRK